MPHISISQHTRSSSSLEVFIGCKLYCIASVRGDLWRYGEAAVRVLVERFQVQRAYQLWPPIAGASSRAYVIEQWCC